MTLIIVTISLGYLFVVLGLALEGLTYKTKHLFKISETIGTDLKFSIIINYRNEANNLPSLLKSISRLDYNFNKIEFIFINDNSSDQSLQILESFKINNDSISIQLINRKPVSNSAKKDGISQALELTSYQHIICTDADVVLPTLWLQAYNKHYQSFPDQHFVAGPLEIKISNNLLSQLQHNEIAALQMTTIGGFAINHPFMCSGANMSFTKQAFQEVNGYAGNDHISSGDDIFLLEKLATRDTLKCSYLKSDQAIVKTYPKKSWKEMITHRVRWAQKGIHTQSILNKLVSIQVLVMSLLFLTAIILWPINWINDVQFVTIISIKLLVDIIVLFIGNRFFNNKKWFFYLLPQLMIYPIVVIIIAFKSLKKPNWKERVIDL